MDQEQNTEKEESLRKIKELLDSGKMTPEDLAAFTPSTVPVIPLNTEPSAEAPTESRSKTLGAALYIVGAVIVCTGVAALIGQSWEVLNTFTRILFTFGLGVLFLGCGAYLKRTHKAEDMLAETTLAIGSVALVLGSGVIVHEAGLPLEEPGTVAILALLLTALNATLYMLLRSPIIAFTGLTTAVVFFHGLSEAILPDTLEDVFAYTMIFNGIWLIVAGIFMARRTVLGAIAGMTRGFGAVFVLGAAMMEMVFNNFLSGEETFSLWQLIYPIFLGLIIYTSITVRSRGLLLISSIFLTLYILYISAQYFTDILGWPFTLMVTGAAMIGIAFGVRSLNQKFTLK